MSDRITNVDGQPAALDEFIDEAVIGDAHVEMMNEGTAWMQLGEHVFWIHARRGRLKIRYTEQRPR